MLGISDKHYLNIFLQQISKAENITSIMSWNYTVASKTFVLAMNENLAKRFSKIRKGKLKLCNLSEVNPALGTTP